ncbi:MAG TPA: hypothetical protein VGF76_05575, partial [Polyangiaceae bacterium]
MAPGPALLLAQPVEPPPGSSLDADVRALGNALDASRHSSSQEDLRLSQKVAHDVMIRAEQQAFAEVANAVFHIEDALTAMADGELEANDATWRQIDAAYRAACAACEVQAAPMSSSDCSQVQGRILLVIRDEHLAEDIARAASRRKFSVSTASSAQQAQTMACAGGFSGLVMDFDDDAPEAGRTLALALRELLAARHCPLVVLAKAPSYALRLAAAESRAAILMPKPVAGDKLMAMLESLDVQDRPERPRLLMLSGDELEARRLEQLLTPLGL